VKLLRTGHSWNHKKQPILREGWIVGISKLFPVVLTGMDSRHFILAVIFIVFINFFLIELSELLKQ